MHCNHLPSPGPCKFFELGFIVPMRLSFFSGHQPLRCEANIKRACMVAENVDVGAEDSKMLAVLVVGPTRYGLSWLKRPERHG
jgi:hypothetical protein